MGPFLELGAVPIETGQDHDRRRQWADCQQATDIWANVWTGHLESYLGR